MACFKEAGRLKRRCSIHAGTKELKNLAGFISDLKVSTIFLQSRVTYLNN